MTKAVRTVPTAKTGKVNLHFRGAQRYQSTDTGMAVAMDSPPPAHDELDTAE